MPHSLSTLNLLATAESHCCVLLSDSFCGASRSPSAPQAAPIKRSRSA